MRPTITIAPPPHDRPWLRLQPVVGGKPVAAGVAVEVEAGPAAVALQIVAAGQSWSAAGTIASTITVADGERVTIDFLAALEPLLALAG